jgi:hypothetical protein
LELQLQELTNTEAANYFVRKSHHDTAPELIMCCDILVLGEACTFPSSDDDGNEACKAKQVPMRLTD